MVPLPEPGADWGGFRIDREIGLGGRGRTFAAFDPVSRRTRALKVLLDVPSDDPAGERFQRHPLAATQLGHRNIITAHSSSDIAGIAYVVMDLYRSGSIADEVGVSILRVGRAREVLAQVAAALDAAHESGLVHGNIKPTNILCGEDGRTVVVTDFGCTRFVDEAQRSDPVPAAEVARLPFHEAPEVLLGDRIAPPADVYSLGSVLFLVLSGRPPFVGRSPAALTDAHRRTSVPALTLLRPDLPPTFDTLIASAMAKDPAERPGSGKEFIGALDEAIKAALDHRRAEARRPPDPPAAPVPTDADSDIELLWEPTPTPEPDDLNTSGAGEPAMPSVPEAASSYGGARRARREADEWHLDDGTVDGALLGVYEEEPARRWLTVVVVVALVAALCVVGWLGYRAIQADDDTVDFTPTSQP